MAFPTDALEFWPLTSNTLTGAKNGNVLTAVGMTYESSAPGPCWKINTNGTDYLLCTTLTLAEPFTVLAEVYVNGGASGSGFTFIGYLKGSTGYYQLYQDNANLLQARSRSGGTAGDASGGGVTGSAFNQCAAVHTSSTSRQAYRDGTLSAAETTSVVPSGASVNFTLGALLDGSTVIAGCNVGWRFRNVAVFGYALTDAQIDSYFSNPSSVLGAAPVLSSPTGAATGNTTANAGATIDAVSGSGSRIMYALARIGGSPASSATIISTGAQLAVTTAGAKSVPLTGLTPGASYSADVVYVDATSGTSNVVTGTWTQPAALAWSGTYPNQSGVAGAAFVHSGLIPAPTGGVGTKTYSATGLGASGLTVNTATGQLQGTCGTAGTYNITPTTTDASTAGTPNPQTASLAAFTLTITGGGGGGGGGGDTTPPTMSAASVTGGTLSATGSITSNETGALWWKMDASATATDPGAGSEAGAGWSSQSMLAAANAVNFGTQPAGLRYGHFLGVDAAGNRAAVIDASGTVTAGAGTYTAQTDIIAVAGIALTNTLVYFSWAPNGRPGSITSPVNGSTTTDSTGRATISHTVAGAGFVIIGTRPGPVVSNDRVFAQFLTLA